jgi:hypothetical protein
VQDRLGQPHIAGDVGFRDLDPVHWRYMIFVTHGLPAHVFIHDNIQRAW